MLELTLLAHAKSQTAFPAFAIWLVDPAKQPSGPPPPPVPENDVYAAPVDAVTVPPSEPVPVICYNQCIRLQCIDTGLLSPLFVIRRLEVANTVMGGDGTSKDQQLGKCPMGESAGDAVSQLHKVSSTDELVQMRWWLTHDRRRRWHSSSTPTLSDPFTDETQAAQGNG